MTEILYKRLSEEDFPLIADIQQLVLPHDVTTQLGRRFLIGHLYPLLLDFDIASHVAIKGGRVIGYCFLCQTNDWLIRSLKRAPLPLLLFTLRHPLKVINLLLFNLGKPNVQADNEIAWIGVHPSYQGLRIGSSLITVAVRVSDAKGSTSCYVKTLDSTPRNLLFYHQNGFQIVARSRGRVFLVRDQIEG